MKAYALLIRKYTDEFQTAAWYSLDSIDSLESTYNAKISRIQQRLHREYNIDKQTFIALKEQAMTF
ncbi:hypothetical protein CHH57_01850 [Niallia circulans]|uniref:Uncharacterized protein n=1 Tax=Niallia circulans TaxID=1397 RepID=A0AA91TW25_NIACI|nr:hypothetical protein [Niallia circulans]PAD84941.1 hypothetical protein CHH57_01850 [Niallia circulans]